MKATFKEILNVIRDGSRIDRYIFDGENGPYITTKNENLNKFYYGGPVSIYIPISYGMTLEQEIALANDICNETWGLRKGLSIDEYLAWSTSEFPEVG